VTAVGQTRTAGALEPVLSALRETLKPHGFSKAGYRFTGRENGELTPVLELVTHRHEPFIEFDLRWGFFSLEYLLLAFPGEPPGKPRVHLGPFTASLPSSGTTSNECWRLDGGRLFEVSGENVAVSNIAEVVETVEAVLPVVLGTTRLSELPPIIERLEREFAGGRNYTWTDDPIAIIRSLTH
jgi:hypothetical protein